MPLDKNALEGLLEEIKRLEKKKTVKKTRKLSSRVFDTVRSEIKKDFLQETEKKVYLLLNHYYKLTLMSIEHTGTALTIWINGILPILLKQHGINFEEWERLCDIGDDDEQLDYELDKDWKVFKEDTIKSGKIDHEILSLLEKGREKVRKMRR